MAAGAVAAVGAADVKRYTVTMLQTPTDTENVNFKVEAVLKTYPDTVQPKLLYLRQLIFETADALTLELEETLKWGEPSYLSPHGSTIRIDWKAKKPQQYAMYFKCTSKLVSAFREVYGNTFNFENTRAIVFQMGDAVPATELKVCIAAALRYHKIKHLPLLGLQS